MRSFLSSASNASRAVRINSSFPHYSVTSQLRVSSANIGRSVAAFSSSSKKTKGKSASEEEGSESEYTSWAQNHWRTPENTSPLGESLPMRKTTSESFRPNQQKESTIKTAYSSNKGEAHADTPQQRTGQDDQLLMALDELEPSPGAVSLTSRSLAEPKKIISHGGRVKTGQKMRERVARYVTEALMSPKMYRDWHLFLDRHHLTTISIHSVDINMASIIIEWEPPVELVFAATRYAVPQEKLDESKRWYSNRERANRTVDEFDVAEALERLAARLKMDLARKMGTRNVRTVIFKLHDFSKDENNVKMEDALGFGMGGLEGIKHVKGLEWMKDIDNLDGVEELRDMPEYDQLREAMLRESQDGLFGDDREPIMGGFKEKKPYQRRKRKHEKQQESIEE